MTVKTREQLAYDLRQPVRSAAAHIPGRNLVVGIFPDLVDSLMEVGGTLYMGTDPAVAVTTAWQPFSWFTNSIDTKGLQENLSQGIFTTENGAGGVYKVTATMSILPPASGWVEIGLTKEGALTPYVAKRSMVAGESGSVTVLGSGNITDGENFGLAIRASGNATITVESAQLMAWR